MEETAVEVITAPAVLIRITGVSRRVLQEMRAGPLDNAARVRVLLLLRSCLAELEQCLDPQLHSELRRLVRIDVSAGFTDKSLQVAMATLVGWLDGLLDGIQMALSAQLSPQRMTAMRAPRRSNEQPVTNGANGRRGPAGDPDAAIRTGQYL